MVGILGNKVGMTQIFTETGDANPVTVIKIGPCSITQIKSVATHGYTAIQIGYQPVAKRKLTKPELGHLEKTNAAPFKYLKEYRVPENHTFEVGQIIDVNNFNEGEFVDIAGTSKGKGFQGVVKRHNFRGVGQATHGQHNRLRAPGSIGAGSDPSRVFKGMRMAGRMGGSRVKVQNLRVLKIDTEKNILVVKGSIPGAKNSTVIIEK